MIFLRFFAFLVGALVLVIPPLVMSDVHTRNMGGGPVLTGLLGLAVVAGSFFFVGMAASRMRRSWLLRILGGVLLMIPAAAGLVVLCTRDEPTLLYAGGLLMGAAMLLFIAFVFPATPDRRQRPMRERDQQDRMLKMHESRQG